MTVEPKAPAEGDRKASFAYDYMGRRVKKESYARQASAWVKTDETRYLYDGWNMIRELNASGQTKKSYVWGIDLSGTLQGAGGIGGLLASTDAATLTHYYFDGNGNVGQLVDSATGNATAHYEYDPFGNVSYSHGMQATLNPYRFSTKYHDDETNLDYYGYRYYSPAMGRWVNRDPIGELGSINIRQSHHVGDIAESEYARDNMDGNYDINVYVITGNDTTTMGDALGLSSLLFSRFTNTLYLYANKNVCNGSGVVVLSCSAANNVVKGKSNWPAGTYSFAYHKKHPADPNGSYGSHGIFVFNVLGRTGMGVHSGKANKKGYLTPTLGCIRTTDQCMKSIYDIHFNVDRLTQITVLD